MSQKLRSRTKTFSAFFRFGIFFPFVWMLKNNPKPSRQIKDEGEISKHQPLLILIHPNIQPKKSFRTFSFPIPNELKKIK